MLERCSNGCCHSVGGKEVIKRNTKRRKRRTRDIRHQPGTQKREPRNSHFVSEAAEKRMKITDIAVHAGGIDQPYKTLGEITAKVSKASLFSSSRTIEESISNFKRKRLHWVPTP